MVELSPGGPPLLEHSQGALLTEAAPEPGDHDGAGRGRVDGPVVTHSVEASVEALPIVALWSAVAFEWFPLPLPRDDVGAATNMLQFCPLQPYTSAQDNHTHTHTHMHTCTHAHMHTAYGYCYRFTIPSTTHHTTTLH